MSTVNNKVLLTGKTETKSSTEALLKMKKDKINISGMLALYRNLMREIFLKIASGLKKVTCLQYMLLRELREAEIALTMTDISRKMGNSTAAATGLIDRLEKLGYVEREHSVDDRRKVTVSLTVEGHKLVGEVMAKEEAYLVEYLSGLNDGQINLLLAIYALR